VSAEGPAWPPKEWDVVESEAKGRVMTERDELAKLLTETSRAYIGEYGAYVDEVEAPHLADAILAAGYSNHSEELAKCKRAAKTLNEAIEKQCRDVLDVTGLHHLINEDGDGHWDAVWMRLFEMRDELADLKESTIARERQRGDSWRDRAQEMTVRAESAEEALAAANYVHEESFALGWDAAKSFYEGDASPRTITTATELDALRRFTVIRSAEGVVYEKQTMWHEAGSRDLVYWPAIALPVVVLQEGWGEE